MAKQAQTKTATKPQQQQPLAGEAPSGNLPAVVEERMRDFMTGFRARQRAYVPLLPPHVTFDKFEASVRAAITKDPELVTKCIPATLFRAAAEAAELGLSLNPTLKEADILKVWNKRMNGLEAQFRPRFMGLMKLAKQSGEIKNITATEVYEWDEFDYERGLQERLEHKPGNKPMDYASREFWGVTHAYCIWTEMDGTKKFEVMDLPDILRIMARTSSKNKEDKIVGPWISDFPEMCRKTVTRRASKYMPLSAEKMKGFASAVNLDDRREGGEQVTLKGGDVLDVTDFAETSDEPPRQTQQQTAAAKSQVDDLESRMAGGKQPPQQPQQQAPSSAEQPAAAATKQPPIIDNPPQKQPAAVSRLEVPRTNGAADWTTWLALSAAAVKELDQAQRVAWKAKHKDLLDNCEFNVPDQMDELIKLLP